MRPFARRWLWVLPGFLVVAGALAAWPLLRATAPTLAGAPSLARLEVYGEVPDFALVERSGRDVARADLLGRVWVADFIYTHCTDSCPVQSLQLSRLQAEFAGAADLRLVSITVDPRHDTPEVLARYAERYGAHPERWLFLTGGRREIYCLAREGFRLGVEDPREPTPPACSTRAARPRTERALALLAPPPAFAHGPETLVVHSPRFVLVDRRGRIRAYHLATDDESLSRLRSNLKMLLAGR